MCRCYTCTSYWRNLIMRHRLCQIPFSVKMKRPENGRLLKMDVCGLVSRTYTDAFGLGVLAPLFGTFRVVLFSSKILNLLLLHEF